MRRASILPFLLLLLLVVIAAPTSALADVPVAVDDPPVAFDDPAPAPATPAPARPEVAVAVAGGDAVTGIADAAVESTPARTTAPVVAAATRARQPTYRGGQLPFTGVDSGLIVVVSLLGSLLLIGGVLLFLGAASARSPIRHTA
jgi:hypothetical protein